MNLFEDKLWIRQGLGTSGLSGYKISSMGLYQTNSFKALAPYSYESIFQSQHCLDYQPSYRQIIKIQVKN